MFPVPGCFLDNVPGSRLFFEQCSLFPAVFQCSRLIIAPVTFQHFLSDCLRLSTFFEVSLVNFSPVFIEWKCKTVSLEVTVRIEVHVITTSLGYMLTYSRVPNKRGVPNKLVGVESFSYQYEKFPKVRLGGGWKGAKNDYLGQWWF